jgi:hypothetical protein
MAGSIKLNAPAGGSVTLNAEDTAVNYVMQVPAAAGILINADSATGAAQLPVGTTAQRPASPVTGQLRFNSTTATTEVYNGTAWGALGGYLAQYLIVAGGGGGATSSNDRGAGGGGAGGLLTGGVSLAKGTVYTVTFGAGCAGAAVSGSGTIGSNSVFFALTSTGGGFGGGGVDGGAGGSGGGAGQASPARAGGAGTAGQGQNGGSAVGSGTGYSGGGGGGAGAVGTDGSTSTAVRAGGIGAGNYITGSLVTYAAGGAGSAPSPMSGGAGAANTGNGGGAGAFLGTGAAGGSGVVVLRVLTSDYSGTTTGSPTVTTDGSYTVIKFTASGSYTA